MTAASTKNMKCGEIKPSTRPDKKIMQCVCSNGKKHIIHAGAKGYANNYSDKARKSFKARHDCAHAKKGTPNYLACNELWKKGGRTTTKKTASHFHKHV